MVLNGYWSYSSNWKISNALVNFLILKSILVNYGLLLSFAPFV